MFTGIVQELGKVNKFQNGKLSITTPNISSEINTGDSISVNGVCLTAINVDNNSFHVDVINETISRTNLGDLVVEDSVNLELALQPTDRMGGHIVQGHIDCRGLISSLTIEDTSHVIAIEVHDRFMKYIVEKGFIAIDGISLTVSKVYGNLFEVSIIPHTFSFTNLSLRKVGDYVNLEVDITAKYIESIIMSTTNLSDE